MRVQPIARPAAALNHILVVRDVVNCFVEAPLQLVANAKDALRKSVFLHLEMLHEASSADEAKRVQCCSCGTVRLELRRKTFDQFEVSSADDRPIFENDSLLNSVYCEREALPVS